MRFVTFEHKGSLRYGLVEGLGVVDLTTRMGSDFPHLRAVLAQGGLAKVDRFAQRGRSDFALSDISFRPVIPNPDKIIAVGMNYRAHAAEFGRAITAHPALFVRFPNSQVGHGQPLIKPRESEMFDYEGEIALIIGKGGRRIPRERAFDHIAGFACYNDGSVRDFQNHTSQFTAGKNFVASGSFGPWLLTRDEVADPSALEVITRLNGIEMQRGSATDLIFGFDAIVAYCSLFTELLPGDVIITGTPSGVGHARTPSVYMKPGDSIEVEITGLGILQNPVSEG